MSLTNLCKSFQTSAQYKTLCWYWKLVECDISQWHVSLFRNKGDIILFIFSQSGNTPVDKDVLKTFFPALQTALLQVLNIWILISWRTSSLSRRALSDSQFRIILITKFLEQIDLTVLFHQNKKNRLDYTVVCSLET